ncbi:MAG: TonB-dependent receptor [Campylobacterota bacterium]|nr:TonB-dependent receptor [Campylobacterota bacterium]
MSIKLSLRIGLSLAVVSVLASADVDTAKSESNDTTNLGTYDVVDSQEMYRHRADTITPTLVYDREFFERFEPMTAGAMLKRVPGVVFKGDIGEYDFIQFRGLAAGYTQILVNGKRVPGGGSDGSINLDRIPAEMVDRIEIVRSPSAAIDSQGIAGTINIILKDGDSMQGGFYRVGMSRHSNGEDNPWTDTKYKPNAFLAYSDTLDTFSYSVSAYYQERYNAKDKVTNEHEDGKDDKDSWVYTEDEYDNRESKDSSISANFDVDVADSGVLSIATNYFHTDREEEQYELKYERDAATDPFEYDETEHQIKDIEKENYTIEAGYKHSFDSLDTLEAVVSYDNFKSELDEYKTDTGNSWEEIEDIKAGDYEGEFTDTTDTELKGAIGYTMKSLQNHQIKFGVQLQNKKRDTDFSEYEVEDGDKSEESLAVGTYYISEKRYDAYAEDMWKISNASTLQFGARLEMTDIYQAGADGNENTNYTYLNPSLSYKYSLSGSDQIRFSAAQTLRRPNFDEMVPFEAEDEPEDFDILIGNPELTPEKSLGFDLGYEHSFAEQFGIIGVNTFYRNVEDKIELSRTGDNDTDDDGDPVTGGIYTPDNVGDGVVYGFELDAGFPLTFIGVPSVSFFANYTYLDSKIEDPFTKEDRQFNDQPGYVYNFGLNHTIRSLGLGYGFSYQKRGDSTYEDSVTTEVTSYDANLEAFIEYKFNKAFVLRFTADNLLDAEVTENMKNYDSLDDKLAGDVDNYETQIERAGAVFMLTLSGRF